MTAHHANRRVRFLLLGVGTVLWIAVIVVVVRMWMERGGLSETVEPPARTIPVARFTPTFHPYDLPDFELTDQNGRKVTKADLIGKPWVASFFFTECQTECPMITARLQKLQDSLQQSDAMIVSISVDPAGDTAAVLDRYAKSHNADPKRWLFLRSDDKQKLYELLMKGFKLPVAENPNPKEGEDKFDHSASVLHVDETGRVVGKYSGVSEVEMERLRSALTAKDDG